MINIENTYSYKIEIMQSFNRKKWYRAHFKMCLEIIYLIYLHKKYLTLNDLQWLIYNKTKPK